MDTMLHYAKAIRRLQRELQMTVSEFRRFGLIGRITTAEEDTKAQNEMENHQLLEQIEDPYRMQRESDLTRGYFG